MYRALAVKELREIWWMGAAAFLFVGSAVWLAMGTPTGIPGFHVTSIQEVRPSDGYPINFLQRDMVQYVLFGGWLLALGLGVWQTMGESFRGTWRFLLHRPAPRSAVMITKIVIGLAVLLVAIGLPILIYVWWAATPGNHASPFEWWMTMPTWQILAACTPVYLAAMLCGLREARWYGSRFLPLAMSLLLPLAPTGLPWLSSAIWGLIVVSDALLVAAILFAAQERDFA